MFYGFDLLWKRTEKDNKKIFEIRFQLTFVFAVESGSTFRFHVISSISILCSVASSMTVGTESYSFSPRAVPLQ